MPKVAFKTLCHLGRELLIAIGEDPNRKGLSATPERFARMWKEFIEYAPGKTDQTFETVVADQLVVVSGIQVWSLCEHHLLPFTCRVAIGYLARDRVLGLSKFARVAHECAHRLQLQERLVNQIAEEVGNLAETNNVAVVAQGIHLCAVMRGIKTPNVMTTSVVWGVFREEPEARAEFLRLAGVEKELHLL